MAYAITREFKHRAFGTIGTVSLSADASITVNGVALPTNSVEYLLKFALQSLQDAYAGAKSEAEATASFGKKLDALLAGTIGVRASSAIDEPTKIAHGIIKAQMRKNEVTWNTFKELSDEEQRAKLDDILVKNAEALGPLVKAEMKRREDERKAKAKLAGGLDLTM